MTERATGIGALAFWVALGAPGAVLYGITAAVLGASIPFAAGTAGALLALMPFVGAICISSGMASDKEGD